jgi:glutathione-regulated potassium-efflux system ancillary protein KefC
VNLHDFLYAAVLLLMVTVTAVLLFKRVGLGSLLGLLVAGMIVGPHGFSITNDAETIRHFTELGVILLMFTIGLEMRPQKLWSMRREVFGLGTLQVVVSGALLAAYALLFSPHWQAALLIGFSLALSSTAFVMQLLQDRNELNTRHGSAAFSVLLLQDLAVVPLLAIIPLLAPYNPDAIETVTMPLWLLLIFELLLFIGLFVAGRFIVPGLLQLSARLRNTDAFWMIVLLAVFGAAFFAHLSGLSMALGAFVMGMLLSGSPYRYQISALIEPYKGLLMGLFFVAVGMSIDFDAIAANPIDFIQHVSIIIILKVIALFGLCLAFGLSRTNAVRIAFMLAQSGEFGFVLFSVATQQGVISDYIFALMIATVSLSMLLTPLMLKIGDYLAHTFSNAQQAPDANAWIPRINNRRVLVFGYGRVGRTVCTMLESCSIPYLALDTDLARVALGKQEKRPVYYGDADNPKLLAAAGCEQALLAVIAVNNVKSECHILSHIQNLNPGLPIIARAWDLASRDRLLAIGVTEATPIAIEGSLQLGAAVLRHAKVKESEIQQVLDSLRYDYALIRRPT